MAEKNISQLENKTPANSVSEQAAGTNPQNQVAQALAYIGVEMNDFNLRNSMFLRPQHSVIHGIGHIYRTMIGCALLGSLLQKPRAGLLAFCGAFIHDLARTNDDIDDRHGANAAQQIFSIYDDLWERYALNEKEREWVRMAVEQHSTQEWMGRGDEGYDVMAILKDADALDRCRIADLDPDMLRYDESRRLTGIIEEFCDKTWYINEDMELKYFIDCCI